jgi:DNA-binding transcriptional LysR family regulator
MTIADMQSHEMATATPDAADLRLALALARSGSLAGAAGELGVDPSTVFRMLQRLERRTGQRLFERGRGGWRAGEMALQWAAHAERIEAEIDAARSSTAARSGAAAAAGAGVAGKVRISTTDTLLAGLLLDALPDLLRRHPLLALELDVSNELASLTRRDADIALRATRQPPQHLVGRDLGAIRAAVYACRPPGAMPPLPALDQCPWIAPDPALPDHPSVKWRRRHLPQLRPRIEVTSILAVMQAVRAGLGVGIVPAFLARREPLLAPITPPLAECETRLWLLTHPESRHLRRIAVVAAHLAETLRLEDGEANLRT